MNAHVHYWQPRPCITTWCQPRSATTGHTPATDQPPTDQPLANGPPATGQATKDQSRAHARGREASPRRCTGARTRGREGTRARRHESARAPANHARRPAVAPTSVAARCMATILVGKQTCSSQPTTDGWPRASSQSTFNENKHTHTKLRFFSSAIRKSR